jgi:hypothetical protein
MRRALIICLILMLPLQWVWAAAASTCLHETSVAAPHFGHHAHKHSSSKAAPDSGGEQALPGGDHADCGVCQLSAAKACVGPTALAVPDCAPVPWAAPMLLYESCITSGPERPDRVATP